MTTARRRPVRSRPSLSRELIAEAAYRLTRDEPTTPLTLGRLGAELGADPTALYRHYRNREELLLDVFDRMYADVLARFRPASDWRESLRAVAAEMRNVLLQRPALVAEVGFRFTGGPCEREAIALTRQLFEQAGLDPAEATSQVRVYGEMMLSHAAMSAASITTAAAVQARELEFGRAAYGSTAQSMSEYESEVFELMFATYVDGLAVRARVAKRNARKAS
jgi:AcrR family transcriptional regulator